MTERTQYFLDRDALEELLHSVGVTVAGDTSSDLICYCPFHDNRDSPAFNISLDSPHLWKCWNGACGKSGNIFSLLLLKGYTKEQAKKALAKGVAEVDDLAGVISRILEEDEFKENKWHDYDVGRFAEADRKEGYPARDYLRRRGIMGDAYEYFQMGYSKKKGMAIIPCHNAWGEMVGVIGRSIEGKRYQYSTGMSKGDIIWNANRARHLDADYIVLTEGSLDAVYIWQAGEPSVGAILGSSVSKHQWEILRLGWYEIVCFFDNDAAGRAVTNQIIEEAGSLAVSVVEYPERMVKLDDGTERPVKDPGELTPEEIQTMLENRKSSLELLFQ